MSSVVVLWLILGYVYFSVLIRIVMFSTRYRCLDCCKVLWVKFSAVFVAVRYFVVLSAGFSIPCGQTLWMCSPSPGC